MEITRYINFFATAADKQAAIDNDELNYPNLSYVEETGSLDLAETAPIDQQLIVAKFNVTDTSNPTKILNATSGVSKVSIDDVEQLTISTGYTFSTTGEHTVKYKISGTTIGQNTFYSCPAMTEATIGNNIIIIGSSAFQDCRSLTSVTIPDSVSSINSSAFARCYGLTSVVIPSGVTRIEGGGFYIGAFGYCTALTSVTVEAITPPTINSGAFDNNASDRKFYVPAASVATYQATSGWSTYASRIQAIQ